MESQANTGENYGISSGFVVNYSNKCAIGGFPEIEISAEVLDNLGKLSGNAPQIINDWLDITGQQGTGPHKIANSNSIDIFFDNSLLVNRILNYDLSINTVRNPIYKIGSSEMIGIDINYPIEVQFNYNMDLGNYDADQLNSYPCKTRVNNLILSLKDHQSNEEYLRYSFDNLILIGQNYTTNVNGNVVMSLQYKTYLGRPTGSTLEVLPECISFTGATGITTDNNCPTGNCLYNSGLMFNCSDTAVIDDSIMIVSIINNGITYGTLKFKYDYTNMTCVNYACVSDFQLIDFVWNYDYIDIYPSVGTVLKPTQITFDCINTQCHTFPFTVLMNGCDLNFCVTLPDQRFCTTTTTTTTTTSTTTPVGPTTTTTTPTTTTTTTPTTTTTTTTTTSTTSTTTSTTTTTTPTTTTTTTTTTTPTTTTTTTLPPCPGCGDYPAELTFSCISPNPACDRSEDVICNCQDICIFIKSGISGEFIVVCTYCLEICGIDPILLALSCGGNTVTVEDNSGSSRCHSCCDGSNSGTTKITIN